MIKTFADLELDPILLEAIEEMGFSRPTQVQAEAIPQALDGRDVLASALQVQVKQPRLPFQRCNTCLISHAVKQALREF